MYGLFENIDACPIEVKDLVEEFNNSDGDYDDCERLQNGLEELGYMCEYGLDSVPYGLRKLD